MEEKYDGIGDKVPGSIPTVNKTVLRKVMEFRDAWVESQKEKCVNFLRENGVENAQEAYRQVTKDKKNINKLPSYVIQLNQRNGLPVVRVMVAEKDDPTNYKIQREFCAGSEVEELRFEVANKRFQK